jgi:3-oxoacyl-(acyl-carrier-protein) synthase
MRGGHDSIFVCGTGAVSPAGWGVKPLREAIERAHPDPVKTIVQPGTTNTLSVRQVPAPNSRPAWLANARLRRTSPITQYSVASAFEALGNDAARVADGSLTLGVIVCVMSGCVNYSRLFYDEALRDPATASPLVFPETVFNAPSSHIAAVLGTQAINYTLVGDPGTFIQGLALASDWLLGGQVNGCLVVGAEEIDWITSHAFRLFNREVVLSDGAGAVYLRREPPHTLAVELAAITDPQLFTSGTPRATAVQNVRRQLSFHGTSTTLVDGLQNVARYDAPEEAAWRDWDSRRISPKKVLGEGLMAASAWQTVVAIHEVEQNVDAAVLSVVGTNQQAIGAAFQRHSSGAKPDLLSQRSS